MCKIEVYKYIDKTIKPNEGIKPLKGLIDNIGIANMLLWFALKKFPSGRKVQIISL